MTRPVLLISFLVYFIFSPVHLLSQTRGVNRDKYKISISKTDRDLRIDGIMDEEAWQKADSATHLQRVQPTDTGYAKAQTTIKLTYTAKTLYVGIICYDPTPGKRPVESLRPDFTFGKNDNFLLFMDTFNDQTNGFSFGLSAAGSLWDGVQANGGTVNLNWDIKWRSSVKNYSDKWVAEFAIPFRSLRYPANEKEWGINFSRLDLKTNEKSSWAPMPRQFATATLAYAGTLSWDKPLPKSGTMFSIIPYVEAKLTKDNAGGSSASFTQTAGMDAKVILSTAMNLDVTINPDYSQVEVDRQQTNLDRFELFFPEKRQFYLENSDLFANLGSDNVRPFFSRRIGLETPVYGGVRLSGKLGRDWRIGIMDIQTGSKDSIAASNFAVAAIQKKVFNHSSITAFFINKEKTGTLADLRNNGTTFNRVAGLEFNLANRDNRWTGKAFYHHSFYDNAGGGSGAAAANIMYSTQFLTVTMNNGWVGANYISETGYIRRKGYYETNPSIIYRFYPNGGALIDHGPGIRADLYFDSNMKISDRELQPSYQFDFRDKSQLIFDVKQDYIRLLSPYDPTNTGGEMMQAGSEYTWTDAGITYTSDIRRPLNTIIGARYGDYFNGSKFTLNAEIDYRYQPYASISFVGAYNDIRLPSPYNSARLYLIGPRLDFTFTNKIFFTSFIQYNNQIDNLNYNFRFQWRYAPVSDLFLVYTENATPGNLRVKNRGFIVKLSYWFN
ncbi:MAG TPA: DUF5916 domain-containing protein [Bacteroidales bacterium]|nr:DUF5916 domain-containing protein [Bacteroidales bacterium]